MARAVSILIATLLLLGVGWAVGNRPASRANARLAAAEKAFTQELGDLHAKLALTEARGYLWEARAHLLMSIADLDERNYGSAGEHASLAHDLIVRAASTPGLQMDLSLTRDMAGSVMGKIEAMDPDARPLAERVMDELGRLLDRVGAA